LCKCSFDEEEKRVENVDDRTSISPEAKDVPDPSELEGPSTPFNCQKER
jgi:hypothetical protein